MKGGIAGGEGCVRPPVSSPNAILIREDKTGSIPGPRCSGIRRGEPGMDDGGGEGSRDLDLRQEEKDGKFAQAAAS